MKSPFVQFAIYTAIFLALGAVIYVFAFYRPNVARIEDLQLRILQEEDNLENARWRDERHPELRLELDNLETTLSIEEEAYFEMRDAWNNYYRPFLPDTFDDGEIRQRIERVVQPHSEGLHIHDFPYSQPESRMTYDEYNPYAPPRGIWLTPVTIAFRTDYHGLIAIMNGFAQEDMDNRIITYSLSRYGEHWNVTMQLDILTQTPHPDRYNGDYYVYDGGE